MDGARHLNLGYPARSLSLAARNRSSRARATRERMVPMGHPQIFGCFGVGEAQDLGQDQCFAAFRVQSVKQDTDFYDVLDPAAAAPLPKCIVEVSYMCGAGPAGVVADLVDDHATGDRQQPGPGRRTAREARQGTDRPQKRFLGKVVGAGRIGEVGDRPPHVALGGLDELRQCGPVALSGGFGEVSNLVIVADCRHG